MWKNQAGKFTTSKTVNVYFCLLEFSVTKIIPWKCHVDNYTTVRCGTILGRDLLNVLRMDLNFSENIVNGGERPYEG